MSRVRKNIFENSLGFSHGKKFGCWFLQVVQLVIEFEKKFKNFHEFFKASKDLKTKNEKFNNVEGLTKKKKEKNRFLC